MDAAIALIALTAMEIVLGIDNIVFIAILTGRLPANQRANAQRLGLGIALVMRVLLLLTISWVLSLTTPIFTIPAPSSEYLTPETIKEYFSQEMREVSVRDLILLIGGLFLIGKSVHEIHDKIEAPAESRKAPRAISFTGVLVQIAILDLVFSLDSVITAVGMAEDLWVMIVAVILAIAVMLAFAGAISRFVEQHPTLKMLALSFLILIGVMLVAEGIGTHFNKGYIYFAMAFSLVVEFLNIRVKSVTSVEVSDKSAA